MLLIDYLEQQGLLSTDDRRNPQRLVLSNIARFSFGERYQIMLVGGKCYDLDDLEVMLAIMHDEFTHWARYYRPYIEIARSEQRKNGGRITVPMLTVLYATRPEFVPSPPLEDTIATIRRSVTMFNLSGRMELL